MVNYVALDFGSNSTRVLIASVKNGEINKIYKKHIVTKMAEETSSSGRISKNAISRVMDALSFFFKEISRHEVSEIYAIGTSAMRDSENSLEIREVINEQFNVDVEIISGSEEAKLTLDGALCGFEENLKTILFDIGGGSTEVIYTDQKNVSPISYQLGVVRMSENVFPSRPVSEKEESRAVELINSLISIDDMEFSITDTTSAIGTAGTFTSLAAISLRLDIYDPEKTHLHTIEKSWLREFYYELRSLSPEEIINKYSCLDPARATTITPGALIALQLMEIFKINKLVISENDILEGLILNKVLN